MRVRKTWFSYVLWFLFSCSLAVMFYFSLSSYLKLLGITNIRQSGGMIAICAVILVIFFCLVEWFFNRKSNRGREKRDRIYAVIGLFLFAILFFLFRILLIPTIDENQFSSSTLFQNAVIDRETGYQFLISTPQQLFTSLLSTFFLFLGNKGIAVWVLQTILQTLCFVFSYFAVKRLAGRIPALTVTLGIAALPMFFNDVLHTQISTLLFLIFMISLWLLSIYSVWLKEKKGKEIVSFLIAFIFGTLACYDIIFSGLLLLPIMVCGETPLKSGLKKACNIGLVILGSVLSYGISAFLPAIVKGQFSYLTLESYFTNRYALHFTLDFIKNFSELNYLFIVFIFCICYIIMFLKTEHDEAHIFLFAALVTALLFVLFSPDIPLSYYYILALCFLAVAGAGVRNLVLSNETSIKTKKNKKMEETKDEEWQVEDVTHEQQPIIEPSVIEPKIQYIENPLPLPKKHEKKEMDYGFEPEEEKMHYDFEITDENAFYDI